MLELGYANNIARRGSDGILGITYDHTFNFTRNFEEPKRYALHPFLDVGYTRFFLGSNALHYGGGLLWHYSTIDERGFRLEYRGYSISGQSPISMTCSPGSAHNRVRFRIQEGAEDVEEQAQ